jgi:hypothetical protein
MRARDVVPESCRQRLLPHKGRLEVFGVRQPGCRLAGSSMSDVRKSGSPAPALQNVGAPTFPLRDKPAALWGIA